MIDLRMDPQLQRRVDASDIVQDVLTDADRAEAAAVGLMTVEDYEARVERGELG